MVGRIGKHVRAAAAIVFCVSMIGAAVVFVPGAARGAEYEPNYLYVGVVQDIPDFNIYNPGAHTTFKDRMLGFGYESICAIDYDNRVVLRLAQSWVFDEGTLTTTIELRQGVLFHDGTPENLSDNIEMTADDVVFSYLIAREGTIYSSNIVNAFDIDGDGYVSETELNTCVQKTGTYSVQMTMAQPYGQFFSVTLGVPIVPMHVWENYLTVDGVVDITLSEQDMTWGTGAFYYAEGVPDSYRTIKRFDGYWGKDYLTPAGWLTYPISVEAVHFTIYASMADAVLALKGSAIDYIANSLAYDQIVDLADNPGIGLDYMADSAYFYLAFNMKREPFGSLDFRSAISHLIDKSQIVDEYMGGLGQVGSAAVPPYFGEWFNPAVTKYPYDLVTATDFLDAGGFVDMNGDGWRDLPDGSLMEEITVLSPPAEFDPVRAQACQMIASNMRSVGINADAEAIDFNVLVARQASFDYQMLSLGFRFTGYSECVSVLFDIYSPLSASNTWAFWSDANPNPYYSDIGGVSTLADTTTQAYADEFLALEDAARASFDTTEQISLVKQGQEIIANAIPCNILYYKVNVEAHNDAWINWTVSEGTLLNEFCLCILDYTGTRGVEDADHPVNAGLSMPGQVLLGGSTSAYVVAIDQTGAPVQGADVAVMIEGVDAGPTVSAFPNTGTTDSSGSFSFDLTGEALGSSEVTVIVTSGVQTSEDSSYIEVVQEVPRTLALKVSPEKTVLTAGESVDVYLTVTDEIGNPVEAAEIVADPYQLGYGMIAPLTVYSDSLGEAVVTYTAPSSDIINRHIVATLSLSASADGFGSETTAQRSLAVMNDSPPDWYVTSVESVTTTALTPTVPTATITVLLTDCSGNPMEGEVLDVTYSNESRVSTPVFVTGATAADGTTSFDVTMADTGVSGGVRVTVGMITLANSIPDTVTLTYADPADVLATDYYGGYIQYDMTRFVGALGSIHVTALVFDQDGAPADGVNASVIIPTSPVGQLMEWSGAEFSPLWEWVGATLQTSADEQNLAATGICATPMEGRTADYMNFWYGYVPAGVSLTGGVYEFDLYGVDVTSLDVITDIYVMPGSWCTGTFDGEEDFGTRADGGPWPTAFEFWGPSLISGSCGYGRAYDFVTIALDIDKPVMVAEPSSYDSSAVGILVTDDIGSPVEGAMVLVYQVQTSTGIGTSNTDYIVEPYTVPYRSDPVYTDVDGQAAVTIVAVPPTYVPTSVPVHPDVHAQVTLLGSLSLNLVQQVAINPQACFVNPVPVIDVQNAGTDIVVQVFVTDAGGNPLEGITVDLVPGGGTVVEPPQVTDSIGNATFHIDTSDLIGIAAGFIPVTVSAGAPAYAAARAQMMIPIVGAGEPGPTAIEGVVSDTETGDPVGGAYIMLTGTPGDYYVVADEFGHYFVEVEPGWYMVVVDETGYLTFAEEVEAIDGATVTFDIGLVPEGSMDDLRLFGWVTDNASGDAIPGAYVAAIEFEYGSYDTAWTDGAGYYEMYCPAAPLIVVAEAEGYYAWVGSADGTGLTELQLDMALDAGSPYEPNLTLEISPYTNVSELNPLNAHFTAQDTDLAAAELIIMKLWNSTAGGDNYTNIGGYAAWVGMDPEWSDFPWSYENGTLTGDVEWFASAAYSGWLSDPATTEYVQAYAYRSISGDESYGLMGYYSNDTLTDEYGVAWFDNVTHEYEEFEFDSTLPAASATDPSGVIDPVIVVYEWHEEMGLWDLMGTMVRLGQRSIADLTFETDYLAPSGEYSAWLLAYDEVLNLNMTKLDFTVDTDPPVADAGDDQSVVVGTALTFSGAGSTDNVGVTSYEWTVTRGATTETFSGVTMDYTFSTTGTYTVTLTVTDGAGHEDSDSATVVVTAVVDEVPVADAGADQTADEDTVVTFDGTDSSDDHTIDNYTWTIEELDVEMYGAQPEYTFAEPGTYHVTLVVTDNASQVSEPDEMILTVTDVTAPTADAGEDVSVIAGATVTLDGSGSSDNVGIAEYTWTFTDGTAQVLDGAEPVYTFENEGDFTVTLTVTDAEGLSDTDEVVVHVLAEGAVPTADAGDDQTATVGDTVAFDGSGSTDDGGAANLNYTWTFEYDGDTVTRYGADAEFTFEIAGEYIVTLTVEDEDGLTDDDTVTITVEEEGSSFIEQYWWTFVLVAIVVVAAVVLFMLMKRKKAA